MPPAAFVPGRPTPGRHCPARAAVLRHPRNSASRTPGRAAAAVTTRAGREPNRRSAIWPGRRGECERLRQVLDDARSGSAAALLLTGEPGIGKTALLEWVAAEAAGFSQTQLHP